MAVPTDPPPPPPPPSRFRAFRLGTPPPGPGEGGRAPESGRRVRTGGSCAPDPRRAPSPGHAIAEFPQPQTLVRSHSVAAVRPREMRGRRWRWTGIAPGARAPRARAPGPVGERQTFAERRGRNARSPPHHRVHRHGSDRGARAAEPRLREESRQPRARARARAEIAPTPRGRRRRPGNALGPHEPKPVSSRVHIRT